MSYLEKFLEGILEELHGRFDGLPLENASEEARKLLEESLLDLGDVLDTFTSDLRECRRCGCAWRECDMEERQDQDGLTYYLCAHCS